MEYSGASDNLLWEKCRRSDDQRAFSELFRRHFNRMLRVATHYIKDSGRAEELVMDCMMNLWNRRQHIADVNFSNYLFRSVRNAVVSFYRKEVQVMVGLEQVELTHPALCATDSPLLLYDIREEYGRALEKLSPRRREVFVLSRHENMSYSEIAQKMNVTESAVKNHMTAALEGLRTGMKI